MGETETWNQLWDNTISEVSLLLRESHDVISQPEPFDTWVQWSNQQTVPSPTQGWKIHLSPHPEILNKTMLAVAALAAKLKISFKLISTYQYFVKLNAGHFGEAQVGKTITIYPATDLQCELIYKSLSSLAEAFLGPQCPGDFYVSSRDRISFRWGQIGPGVVEFDSLGKAKTFVFNNQGLKIEDIRTVPGQLPEGVNSIQILLQKVRPLKVEVPTITKFEDQSYKVRHNFGNKLKQILLVENEDSQNFFIIKRVWKGLGITTNGRTYEAEAKNDHLITNHSVFKTSTLIPKVISTQDNGQFYELLIEDAGGDSLEKLPLSLTIKYWPEILRAVQGFHQAGFVHRDIKRRNLVLNTKSKNKVSLIDFELAGRIGDPLPCSSGTSGFKAPESIMGASFHPTMDLYALGSLIFEMAMGRDPSFYLLDENKREQLLINSGFQKAAVWVQRLSGVASERPSIAQLMLEPIAVILKKSEGTRVTHFIQPHEILSSVCSALKPFKKTLNKTTVIWKNNHLLANYTHRGLNIGSAGILLGLTELYSAKHILENNLIGLNDLIEQTANGLINGRPYEHAHGFMTGNAGSSYALVKAGLKFSKVQWIEHATEVWLQASTSEEISNKDFDFFSGRAGVLFAGLSVLKARTVKNQSTVIKKCELLVQSILDEVVDYEGLWAWPVSIAFGGNPTLGASHWAAGIAMVLALWARETNNSEIEDFAVEVFQRIYQFGRSSDQRYLRYDVHPDSDARTSTDWCHGSAGYLWAILNSGLKSSNLKTAIEWASTEFLKSSVASNPTYCHGLAGQLELAMMLKNDIKVTEIRQALLIQRRKFRGEWIWPSENPAQFTPDLWVGFLGPAVAIHRSLMGYHTALLC